MVNRGFSVFATWLILLATSGIANAFHGEHDALHGDHSCTVCLHVADFQADLPTLVLWSMDWSAFTPVFDLLDTLLAIRPYGLTSARAPPVI